MISGEIFRARLEAIDSERVELVRGRGLLNAAVITPMNGTTAWDVCLKLKENGLLAKPTHGKLAGALYSRRPLPIHLDFFPFLVEQRRARTAKVHVNSQIVAHLTL